MKLVFLTDEKAASTLNTLDTLEAHIPGIRSRERIECIMGQNFEDATQDEILVYTNQQDKKGREDLDNFKQAVEEWWDQALKVQRNFQKWCPHIACSLFYSFLEQWIVIHCKRISLYHSGKLN